ncbi:endo alpha-1,4 polygalactosaminidase, partial [Aspergillus saccharolyticus JOP 1030-1]
WQPQVASTWQIILTDPIDPSSIDSTTEVYDIDLWINEASAIESLHAQNRKVICYFSAGSYENYRPDKADFASSDLGNMLDGWPDEKWLDIRSANVRRVLAARLDLARQKGCDGVDPDNVDGYDNDNGLGLTAADAVSFIGWLASEAHARGLSIGLKNAGSIIADVIGQMQWCVNEQCAEMDECQVYAPFVQQNKPVFHIEYPKAEVVSQVKVAMEQKNKACEFKDAGLFSTVIKNINLDAWVEVC